MFRYLKMYFLIVVIAFSSIVSAHPHIFVDGYYKIIVNDASVEELEAFWLVDELTSTSIIMGYDLDLDGQITGTEKEELIVAFDSFKEQGYFLKIEKNGQRILPYYVLIADLEVRNEQLWLRLEITLPDRINLQSSTLSLAFGDDTMYTAVTPDLAGLIQLSGKDAERCTPAIRLTEEITIDSWGDLRCY